MREPLLDLLNRLVSVREGLGDPAFLRACQRARLAIAMVALDEAESKAGLSNSDETSRRSYEHATRLLGRPSADVTEVNGEVTK